MNQILSLIFGFTILYLFSWLFIALFVFLYSKISHKTKSLSGSILSISALLAFINVVIMMSALIFLSFNKYLYYILTLVLVAYSFFLTLKKHKKQKFLDAIILSIGLALLLNPSWFGFVGIM